MSRPTDTASSDLTQRHQAAFEYGFVFGVWLGLGAVLTIMTGGASFLLLAAALSCVGTGVAALAGERPPSQALVALTRGGAGLAQRIPRPHLPALRPAAAGPPGELVAMAPAAPAIPEPAAPAPPAVTEQPTVELPAAAPAGALPVSGRVRRTRDLGGAGG